MMAWTHKKHPFVVFLQKLETTPPRFSSRSLGLFLACFVQSLKLSHSVRIKVVSGAAQINVPNISGDTTLMGCSVSGGRQDADLRLGEFLVEAFISVCGRRRVSDMQLAAAVVISSTGWEPQDVLQVVRRWVWWGNVIDGKWAQRGALWRLWLAEIGKQLFLSAFLTSRHHCLPLGGLSRKYSQLVCVCLTTMIPLRRAVFFPNRLPSTQLL